MSTACFGPVRAPSSVPAEDCHQAFDRPQEIPDTRFVAIYSCRPLQNEAKFMNFFNGHPKVWGAGMDIQSDDAHAKTHPIRPNDATKGNTGLPRRQLQQPASRPPRFRTASVRTAEDLEFRLRKTPQVGKRKFRGLFHIATGTGYAISTSAGCGVKIALNQRGYVMAKHCSRNARTVRSQEVASAAELRFRRQLRYGAVGRPGGRHGCG